MRRITLWIIIIQCGFTPIFSQGFHTHSHDGHEHMRNGNFSQAQTSFFNAMHAREDPDSVLYYGALYIDALARGGEMDKVDSFLTIFDRHLEQKDISNDVKSYYLFRKGWIFSRNNQNSKALQIADSALDIAHSKWTRSLALSLKGTLLSMMENQSQGLVTLLEAEHLMNELQYKGKDYGVTLMNIGNVYATKNNNLRSRDYFFRACQILMDYYGEQHPHYYIIKLFYSRELTQRNEFDEAKEVLLNCISHFRKKGDVNSLIHCYHNLTDNSLKSGDFEKALNYLEINLGISKKHNRDTTYNHAVLLNSIIACLRDLNETDEAWLRLDELESLCLKYPTIDQWFYKDMLSNKALLLSDESQYDEADRIYAQVEEYLLKNYGKNSEPMADHYYARAENFKMSKDYDNALKYHNLSADYYLKNYDSLNHNNIHMLLQRGEILEGMGDLEKSADVYLKAKSNYDAAFGYIPTSLGMSYEFESVAGRDKVYLALLRISAQQSQKGTLSEDWFKSAHKWLEEAKVYYNFLVSELYQVENSETLIKQFHSIGSYGQLIYYNRFQKEKKEEYLYSSLSLAEMTKNYSRRIILNDKTAKRYANIPDSLLMRDKEFNRQVQYYESMLKDGYENEELVYRLNEVRDKWHQFIRMLEDRYPAYYSLKYNPVSATGRDIQEYAIDKEIDVLYYFFGDGNIFNYLINDNGIDLQLNENVETLDSIVLAFQNSMINDDVQQFYLSGTRLYEITLKDWEPSLHSEKICVVPDNVLSYLNFESIPYSLTGELNSFKDITYIIEKYNIYYRYEFTSTLNLERVNPKENGREQLGVAFVPVFDADTYKNSKVLSLPWSYSLAAFLKDRINMLVFDKEKATKQNFLETGSKADLLHLSTHAFANDLSPMKSYLLFSGENGNTDSLSALDIIGTDLNAQLALLSACQTGLSEYQLGFGLKSLAWSFEYAGCKNFLVSLWSIDDEVSTSILKDFYDKLGEEHDQTVTQALRQSKIQSIQEAGIHKANPYYWAGMIFIGNDMNMELVTSGMNYEWLWVLIPILVIILYFYNRKKTNARKHSS